MSTAVGHDRALQESVEEPTRHLCAIEEYTIRASTYVAPLSTASLHSCDPHVTGASHVKGRALETLSHAVDYLIDCGMFHRKSSDLQSNQAAVQILMRASRRVFENCSEVLPVGQHLQLWSSHVATSVPGIPVQPAC